MKISEKNRHINLSVWKFIEKWHDKNRYFVFHEKVSWLDKKSGQRAQNDVGCESAVKKSTLRKFAQVGRGGLSRITHFTTRNKTEYETEWNRVKLQLYE